MTTATLPRRPAASLLTALPFEQWVAMSYEEYLQLADEHQLIEWVDGEVIAHMPPGTRHQQLQTFLAKLLGLFVEYFGLGELLVAPFEMRLARSAREPDLLFIATEHLDRLDAQRLRGPADLAVEIMSPESTSRDRAEKFAEYQAGGVREYWVIDVRPGQERAEFWLLDAGGRYRAVLPDANGIVHAAVLPGFWLDVAWLWQNPLPSALAAFAEIADLPAAVRRALQPRS
jgi:Uma2 family endonuclease